MPALSCDPAALVAAAKCGTCLGPKTHLEIQTYLLTLIAGVSPDLPTLTQASKCFKCVPSETLLEIQTYLLCQIVNAAAATP